MTLPAHLETGAISGLPMVIEGGSELSVRTSPRLVRGVRQTLEAGPAQVLVSLDEVKVVDVVGLAALTEAVRRLAAARIPAAVVPSPTVYYGALEAGLLDELPLAGHRRADTPPAAARREEDRDGEESCVIARTCAFALRRPRWDDLAFFDRWAQDERLCAMVGSELLYRCRHLGPFHPEFTAAVLHHPTSLTLLVQAAEGSDEPLGFVRLYGVNLSQGFAFLESTIVSRHALRRGWGVAASRLLSFYAQDVLGMRRVEAKVYEYNRLSINALRRNGFTQEGVLRRAAVRDGDTCDILVFGILDEEIRAQRRREGYPYMGFWGTSLAADS